MIKCFQKAKSVRLFLLALCCVNGLLHAEEAQAPDVQPQAAAPAGASAPAAPDAQTPSNTTPANSQITDSVTQTTLNENWASDLFELYGLAEQNDPQIRAAYSDFQAVEETVPQNWANLLPQISGSVNAAYDDSKADPEAQDQETRKSDGESTGYELRATQVIYNHAYWQRLSQANINAAQAEANYNAARQDLIVRIATAYFNVLGGIDSLAFAEAERKSVEQQLEQTKQRFEVGLIAITDVKESQARFDQAVAQEIEAQNTLSTTREALWTIVNTYPQQLKPLSEQMPLLQPEPADKQHWVDKALAENLSLIAADLARQAAQQEVDIQRSGHYPTIDVTARHTYRDDEAGRVQVSGVDVPVTGAVQTTDTSIMVSLNVPIFTGGGTHARVKEAVYRREATRDRYEATRRQVIQQTRDAYQNILADISRVKALKQALISSEAAYEATSAGYEVGTRNSVEVLTALRNVYAAKRDYARTRYTYVVDLLRLKQATGNLSMADLKEINRWLQ
ncbi:MAG TPA: TolC family outer membrane protein [Gammaproteobacteria bacterium]|nr:TolC family outer membrane protein [Gammaproteobacteria bacterium]